MPVEILGEIHPALFRNLSEVRFRGAKVAVLDAFGATLIEGGANSAPVLADPPRILPPGAGLGDSITLSPGSATGQPEPVAEWDSLLDGASVRSRVDAGMMTMELAEPGEYLLVVTWTNSEGALRVESEALTIAAPEAPAIDYPAVALAYLDAGSAFAGSDSDVTSVSPAGTGNLVFSKSGSGSAITRGSEGFTFASGSYLQSQILSSPATTDGLFAVIDLTITSYGSAVTQLFDGTGTTLKLRNNAGNLQAVGPVSGLGALALGQAPYGSRIIISGQLDDIADLLSGHDVSGGVISAAHTGLSDPTPTRFITGRYLNGTIHRLAIVGRPEGGDWPVTMQEVVADFQRGE